MKNLRKEIEELLKDFRGFPVQSMIREQMFRIVRQIIDERQPEASIFVEFEEQDDCFTGKIVLMPIPEEVVNKVEDIGIRVM